MAPSRDAWRQRPSVYGNVLDLSKGARWLTPSSAPGQRTPGVIFSVAHLEGEVRALVLGLLLDEVLSWVRTLPGTQRLRALMVIDEVYGLLPPHPAAPTAWALCSPPKTQWTWTTARFLTPAYVYRSDSNAGHDSELKAATVVLAEKPLDGPVLKSTRKVLGLKQTELGLLLGYDAESVSRWEKRSREIPRAVPLALRHLVERATKYGDDSLKSSWKLRACP